MKVATIFFFSEAGNGFFGTLVADLHEEEGSGDEMKLSSIIKVPGEVGDRGGKAVGDGAGSSEALKFDVANRKYGKKPNLCSLIAGNAEAPICRLS